MKILFIATLLFSLNFSSFAQKLDEEKDHKFRQENIFLGGSIGLGLGSGVFSVGANPEVGYTVAEWLDAGISTNLFYNSISAEYNGGVRQRSFNYGGGIFTRIYPLKSIFIQVLPEYNFIKTTLKDISLYGTQEEIKITQQAPSLLLGIGYTTREIGSSNFYTLLMFDAGNNTDSPYIGYLGSKDPILRAGFNVYLGRKRK